MAALIHGGCSALSFHQLMVPGSPWLLDMRTFIFIQLQFLKMHPTVSRSAPGMITAVQPAPCFKNVHGFEDPSCSRIRGLGRKCIVRTQSWQMGAQYKSLAFALQSYQNGFSILNWKQLCYFYLWLSAGWLPSCGISQVWRLIRMMCHGQLHLHIALSCLMWCAGVIRHGISTWRSGRVGGALGS